MSNKTPHTYRIGDIIYYTNANISQILKGTITEVKWIKHRKEWRYTAQLLGNCTLTFWEKESGKNVFLYVDDAETQFAHYHSNNFIDILNKMNEYREKLAELSEKIKQEEACYPVDEVCHRVIEEIVNGKEANAETLEYIRQNIFRSIKIAIFGKLK